MSFRRLAVSALLAIWLAASVQAGHVVFDGGYQNGWSGPGTVSFGGFLCIDASGEQWSWHHISNSAGVDLTGLGYLEYEIYFDSVGVGNRVEWHVVAPDGKEWDGTYQFMNPLEIDGAPSSYPHQMTTGAWHTVRLDCSAQSWWMADCDSIRYIKWQWPLSSTVYIRAVRFIQAGNLAPSVDAGEDQTITSPVCEVGLNGSVTDDGLPDPPAAVSSTWSMVSGPAAVAFGDTSSPTTAATFSAVGTYELRLMASDGESTGSDTVTVTVEDFSADLNSDGIVDFADVAYVAEQWLLSGGTPSADIHPAPTPDGIVNLPDYAKMANHWSAAAEEQYVDGWRMAGANPQRTSWVPEDVGGVRYLEWYKPFAAMIAHKVQVVAVDGLLYISTTRGLYALDAANGDEVWVYPTELPLGHSPTVVNGVAYVGCFDRRIHAIDAATGAGVWTSAIAGGGFDTNPLVVRGKVIAGNRDGILYCFDASTGATLWTHETDSKQPICFSCAYKDGVVYFAANDMHAYAVNITTGARVWKSAKLPGAAFYSWWPVIHGDYVVFTGSSNYRESSTPSTSGGLHQLEDTDIFGSPADESGHGGAVVSSSPLVLDFSQESDPEGNGPITEYLRTKPWRRTYFLLRRSNGTEVMYDFNNDGQMEYAPHAYMGTHSGSRTPPVVGNDGYEYILTGGVLASPYISRGGICRWALDSSQVRVFSNLAHDEPTILSGGGNQIHYYHGEWRDGTQGSVNIATGQTNQYYWYIWNVVPDLMDYLRCRPNDMYGIHGDQNPGISYNGKVYNQRWGYVMCWSSSNTKTKLSTVAIQTPGASAPSPTVQTLQTRLAEEVQKMIDAGHLRSGWLNRGLAANGLEQHVSDHFDDYFSWPGETIWVLCRALPYLPTEMQQAAGDYIASEFSSYPPDVYAHIGWQGAAREAEDIPPEYNLSSYGPSTYASQRVQGVVYNFPPHANYALYQYAKVFGNAGQLVSRLRSLSPPSDATLIEYPWAHNAYIAGYAGIVGLKRLAGQSDPAAEAELNRLLQLRATNFTVDWRPAPPPGTLTLDWDGELAIMRNFMFMTPELADYLRTHILSTVQTAWSEYDTVNPFWFIGRACEGISENVICPLWDCHVLFQAKAQILQESYEELVKYLDVPAYWRGDLYYIDNLCAALEAAERDSVIECGTGQAISDSVNVAAMVNEAVSEARAAYGTGKPKVILLAEQIDSDGSVILPALRSEFGTDVPICGVHNLWNDSTPFTMDSFPKQSPSYKSVAVMALGGGLAVQTVKADGILPMWDEPIPYDEAIQCGHDLAVQLTPSENANNLILIMGAQHNPGAVYFMKGVRQVLTGDQEGELPANIRVIGWGTMDETDDVYFNSQRYFYRDLPDGSSVVAVMLTGNFDWAFSGQEQSGNPAGAEPYTGWANAIAEIPVHIQTLVTELGGVPDATFFIPAHPGREKFAAIETAVEAQLGGDASLFGWHGTSETGHDSTNDGYSWGTAYHFFVAGIKGGLAP